MQRNGIHVVLQNGSRFIVNQSPKDQTRYKVGDYITLRSKNGSWEIELEAKAA